jgi:hypothetical protein
MEADDIARSYAQDEEVGNADSKRSRRLLVLHE